MGGSGIDSITVSVRFSEAMRKPESLLNEVSKAAEEGRMVVEGLGP